MDQFASLRSQLSYCHTLSQSTPLEEVSIFHQQVLALQQGFQGQVLPLTTAADPQLQPILTELNRCLRLLAMDVAFWRSSREPLTQQQRQQQIGERLAQLGMLLEMLSDRLVAIGRQGNSSDAARDEVINFGSSSD
jgi:hypothetical protein